MDLLERFERSSPVYETGAPPIKQQQPKTGRGETICKSGFVIPNHALFYLSYTPILERANGIEPSYQRRQRRALPLSYARNNLAGKAGLEPTREISLCRFQRAVGYQLPYFPRTLAGELGLEPRLFCFRGRRVASYTTRQ